MDEQSIMEQLRECNKTLYDRIDQLRTFAVEQAKYEQSESEAEDNELLVEKTLCRVEYLKYKYRHEILEKQRSAEKNTKLMEEEHFCNIEKMKSENESTDNKNPSDSQIDYENRIKVLNDQIENQKNALDKLDTVHVNYERQLLVTIRFLNELKQDKNYVNHNDNELSNINNKIVKNIEAAIKDILALVVVNKKDKETVSAKIKSLLAEKNDMERKNSELKTSVQETYDLKSLGEKLDQLISENDLLKKNNIDLSTQILISKDMFRKKEIEFINTSKKDQDTILNLQDTLKRQMEENIKLSHQLNISNEWPLKYKNLGNIIRERDGEPKIEYKDIEDFKYELKYYNTTEGVLKKEICFQEKPGNGVSDLIKFYNRLQNEKSKIE